MFITNFNLTIIEKVITMMQINIITINFITHFTVIIFITIKIINLNFMILTKNFNLPHYYCFVFFLNLLILNDFLK